jgi:predicted transcriptional regulator
MAKTTGILTVNIDHDLKAKLAKLAKDDNRTMTSLVLKLISDATAKMKKKTE